MVWDLRNHRAAWRGRDLAVDPSWQYHLGTAEIDDLGRAALTVVASSTDLRTVTARTADLPSLATAIGRWSEELERGRGFVLIRGIPIDAWSPAEVEAAYVILGAHLGVAVSQNAFGDLLGHVRDDGSDPDDPAVRLYRTREPQPFHVDGSDAVGLLCLHAAKSGGLSQIVSSVSVYNEIARRRPDLEPLLHEPWHFDLYGQQAPGHDPWFTAPILSGSPTDFRWFYLRWYIDKAQGHAAVPRLTPQQVELLDLVDTLALSDDLRLDMDFVPGDVQLLSNRLIMHARTGYEDFPEPERKRHLLRLWLTLHRNTVAGEGWGAIPPKA